MPKGLLMVNYTSSNLLPAPEGRLQDARKLLQALKKYTQTTLKKGGGALPETQMLFLRGLFIRQFSAEMLDS